MLEGSLFESLQKRFSKQFETRDIVYNILKDYILTSKNISIKKTTITLLGVPKTKQKELKFKEYELLEKIKEVTKIQYSIMFQ